MKERARSARSFISPYITFIAPVFSTAGRNLFLFNGYYVVASYTITGEMRSYNKRSGTFRKLNVANGLNSGGWGELDVYSRWSSIDLNDKNVTGGAMNTFSLGLNWSPISSIQVNVNYRYTTLNYLEQTGSNHGLVVRLVFIL